MTKDTQRKSGVVYFLHETKKLQEENERLKDACSKGQRTAEKLAKENYSLHNEIQGW